MPAAVVVAGALTRREVKAFRLALRIGRDTNGIQTMAMAMLMSKAMPGRCMQLTKLR